MMFVVLSGVPLGVDPEDLTEKINIHFEENKEIGTFQVNVDDSEIRKPKVVLKFKQGFDAIEAQRLIDNFKYINPEDNLIYNIKAVVPTNDQPYQSLFREKVTDIPDVILAEEKKAKKRKHSPIDINRLEISLETAEVEKQDPIPKTKYKKEQNLERKGESSETSTHHERSRSDKEKHSNDESTDTEFATIPELYHGRKLLVLEPSNYLTENDVEFNEAVAYIIYTVATNTERLQDEDKKLILENYKTIVVDRLKRLKFTNLMSIQDIVLDYKLVYRAADDKLLINNWIKELQALGKGKLLPEIKWWERLNQPIDEALEITNIEQLMADVKLNIQSENILEYEYEDGKTTQIVINVVPFEKRDFPFETDPDKVADIKTFVGKLKKTKPNKFFISIRILLNEMKTFMYNYAKVVPTEVILNRMVEVLEKILTRMMEPIKTRIKSRAVCNFFRYSFPYKEDQEFVDKIIKWIIEGDFDNGAVDRFIMEKIPKIEKNKTIDEDKSTNVHIAPIQTQPQEDWTAGHFTVLHHAAGSC